MDKILTKEELKDIITKNFKGKEFTMGDTYYTIYSSWNRSKFGFIFNTMKTLTRENFLKYQMKMVGTPRMESKIKRKGAVFSLA